MAARGLLTPLPEGMGAWTAENYGAGQSWVDLGTYADKDGADQHYGFFYNVNVKSLVWYVPENFEDAGYEVPTTMEGLKAMTEQIVSEGETPWCIGLGSGAATGWPATDWVEDLMLRTQTPDVYDQWVTNEIPFDDPRVVAAIEEFGWFARNDANVAGADVDFFYMPAYESKDLGSPVLGGGTLMAITDPSDATNELMGFFQLPIAHEIMMAQTGFLTPHKGANPDTYLNDTLRKQGKILVDASTFRFDGSDLMPGAVGAGSFWTGMVDYAGGKDAGEVAADIQASWPK